MARARTYRTHALPSKTDRWDPTLPRTHRTTPEERHQARPIGTSGVAIMSRRPSSLTAPPSPFWSGPAAAPERSGTFPERAAQIGSYGAVGAGRNRCTNCNPVSATSRQPWSIVREWPRFGIFTISVTAELRLCRL